MTPFAAYILTDALFLGLLVCSLIWLFKTSAAAIWQKVALAVAFGVLVCWSPLATRAILGYPQPRALSGLPDRFQLLAEHTADDQTFDLWIKSAGGNYAARGDGRSRQATALYAPLRSTEAGRRRAGVHQPPDAKGRARRWPRQCGGWRGKLEQNGGAPRTNFSDDQTRWMLNLPSTKWRKDGD